MRAGVEHVDEVVAAAFVGGLSELRDAGAELVQFALDLVGTVLEEAVHVAEGLLDLPHGVDAALDRAHGHARLQQDEDGLDPFDEGSGRIRDEVVLADETVLKPHSPGARSLHPREGGTRLEFDRVVEAEDEEDLVRERAVGGVDAGHRAAVLARTYVAYPG